jgi:hypothetical protein
MRGRIVVVDVALASYHQTKEFQLKKKKVKLVQNFSEMSLVRLGADCFHSEEKECQ